jgi:TnpA family transposase
LDKSAELNASLLCRTEAAAHPILAKVIFFSISVFIYGRSPDAQQNQAVALYHRIAAIIYWTTMYIGKVADPLR